MYTLTIYVKTPLMSIMSIYVVKTPPLMNTLTMYVKKTQTPDSVCINTFCVKIQPLVVYTKTICFVQESSYYSYCYISKLPIMNL